jgi:tripartite-type tricarboxylate transporter receptor subunit TctC
MDRRTLLETALLASLGVFNPFNSAWAKGWPQRPVKFIVPLGAGSALDITARLVVDRLSKVWGKPVVVENRPGGDSLVAISAFVSARDDHVLLFTGSTTFAPHPFVHDSLPYDAARDVIPIAGISELDVGIAVSASLGANSLAELVQLARQNPGKLNWGAISSLDDFLFSGFLKNAGLSMSRVPYRDPISALNDLSEGRIDLCVAALALSLPRAQTGKVRLIAVTNAQRSAIAPNLPTVAEAGYPSLGENPIMGLFGPSVMTATLREQIATDLKAVAADASVGVRLKPTGQMVHFVPTERFAAIVEGENARVAQIAAKLGIVAKK